MWKPWLSADKLDCVLIKVPFIMEKITKVISRLFQKKLSELESPVSNEQKNKSNKLDLTSFLHLLITVRKITIQ